jgi:menaquinone-dependent protoporphyrinogen oxidase
MANTLLLHSSVYGLSRRICERIAARLTERGERSVVAALTDAAVDPAAFDCIVIGASIKHGKHHPTVLDYFRRHQGLLQARPSALFSVNLVARKPGKDTPQTNPYLKALLAHSPWQPRLTGVFAGELDYSRYGTVDRQLMRFVMWINRGPTDPRTRQCFTRWDAVDRFADDVVELARSAALRAPSAAAAAQAGVAALPVAQAVPATAAGAAAAAATAATDAAAATAATAATAVHAAAGLATAVPATAAPAAAAEPAAASRAANPAGRAAAPQLLAG